ncbi:alanine racemase [Pseudomonas putida]
MIVVIMTHFAVEDRNEVLNGLEAFKQQSQWIIDNAHLDRLKLTLHCANLYTIQNVPEAWLDMVRPRSLLYGEPIVNGPEYKRVLSFKSTVGLTLTWSGWPNHFLTVVRNLVNQSTGLHSSSPTLLTHIFSSLPKNI